MAGKSRMYSKKTGMKKYQKEKAFTKEVRKELKNISYKTQETKQINVPDATTPGTNTIDLVYPSASGLQYLFQDAFKVARGTDDSTAIGAANRIGNTIYAKGILMNYSFQLYSIAVSPVTQSIPFVRVRIIVFQATSTVAPAPGTLSLLDTNFMGTGSFTNSTQQPIKYNGGFVKRVLYDKTKVLKNNYTAIQPAATYPQCDILLFKKYIKLNQKLKYTTFAGEPTEEPIHCCIIAEVDNSNAQIASGTRLVLTNGYSQCFYKDG